MYSMDSQREWWKGNTNLKQKKSVEDYLKTIYILSGKKDVHGADTFCWLLTGLGVDEKRRRLMPARWSMLSVRRVIRH